MKQRVKRLMAVLLSVAISVPVLPVQSIMAAAPVVSFTEAQDTMVSHYGEERSSLFNDGWKFYLGKSAAAQNPDFNDASWENVDLPHDFSISQEFTTSGEAESGFLPGGTGWYRKSFVLPESCAGKTLELNFDGVYSHATVYVNGTKVGEHRYGYTSFAFDITDYVKCDASTENVIAVEAVNNIPSSRWYSGSGIYRDVHLIVTDPVHVALNGTFVTTPKLQESNGTDGTVSAAVEVQNDSTATANITVRNTVYEKDSTTALVSTDKTATVAAGAVETVQAELVVPSPKLWDIGVPNLYVVRTEILKDGKTVDSYDTEFGFKWYEFVANQGFKLNGKNVKINGVCMHHDQGALGYAAYYDAMYRQLTILQDMGVNTIRATHNPYDQDFVDICNELGMLVIEEAFDGWSRPKNGNSNDFAAYFKKNLTEDNQIIGGDSSMTWAEFVIKSMVKRDRNDPAIILWSLGNEIDEGTDGQNGEFPEIAANLIRWIKDLDQVHPATIGSNRRTSAGNIGEVINTIQASGGVPGFNYGGINEIDNLHNTYPVILYSETASAVTSRGIYVSQRSSADADGKMHLTSYDTSCVGWGKTAHTSMWNVMTRDYLAGECVWTGFDYIGEPTPWNGTGTGSVSGRGAAPNSSYFGIIDTAGFPKDTYYLYRSQWNQNANTLHLVTAWDSANMMQSNGKTPVWVYTNAAKVELYRDRTKIGTATRTVNTTEAGHTYYTYTTESNDTSICTTTSGSNDTSLYSVFNVAFQDGTISAKAFDESGKEITDTCSGKNSVSTPGAVSRLNVKQNRTELQADGSSLVYIEVDVEDANGNLDTTADNTINFTLEGKGEILGVDNGDQASVEKFQQPSVLESTTSAKIKAYAGKALVIAKSTTQSGEFTVNVSSNGLTGKTVNVTTTPVDGKSENGIVSYRMSRHCYAPVGTTAISLPASVEVTYADGSKKAFPVTWGSYDKAKLNQTGMFNIGGTLSDGSESVNVSLTVHVYNAIEGAKNYSAITTPGVMPVLPDTAMTCYVDGTPFEEFPVSWNMSGITADSFADAGTVVKISGTVKALGKDYPITASIRVAQPIEGELINISDVATLSQSCDPASDSLDSLINGVKYSSSGATSQRWTNWNDLHKAEGDPVITMKWDTAHTVSEINVFYFTDANVKMAKSIAFKYSLDGSNYTDVEYETPVRIPDVDTGNDEEKVVNGYSYKLKTSINPIAIQVIPKPDGTYVGMTEVEVFATDYSYEVNTSAALTGISVGGKAIANFNPDVTEYVVDSVENITTSDDQNAAVTILPATDDGCVTIISVSEDGKETRTYKLSRKASQTERAAASAKVADAKKTDSSLYTADSYAKYMSTVAEIEKNINNAATPKQLNDCLKALEAARAVLVKKSGQSDNKPPVTPDPVDPTPALKKGQTVESNKMQFQVADADAKTVVLTKGRNKKAAKVSVPATVKVNGVSCKVVKISANAFKGYSKLKSATIGSNVTSIEKNAFNGCKKLSKVIFKGTAVKTIKAGAFKNTAKKITVTVPKNLKKNKKAAAAFQKKLTKAGMSKNVKIK